MTRDRVEALILAAANDCRALPPCEHARNAIDDAIEQPVIFVGPVTWATRLNDHRVPAASALHDAGKRH